jgi:hypothetical protein
LFSFVLSFFLSFFGIRISYKKVLDLILCNKFSNRPGHEMVKRRQYIMQDELSGRELHPAIPLDVAVRPGQKMNMCMVFYSKEEPENTCPRCGTITLARSDEDVEWYATADNHLRKLYVSQGLG